MVRHYPKAEPELKRKTKSTVPDVEKITITSATMQDGIPIKTYMIIPRGNIQAQSEEQAKEIMLTRMRMGDAEILKMFDIALKP